jgi:methionine biosynthesis protein MetW
MRRDHQIISQWIQSNSKVLDLGCGKGELLAGLKTHKNIVGYGLEIDPDNITNCINKGVNVVEQDLDTGLGNFKNQAFNTVVMTQALQAVKQPDVLLDEMLRIGEEAIITFPNFGHWRTRAYLGFKGRMPISKTLPYTWYNTPNIHLCTFKDFEALCFRKGLTVVKRTVVDQKHYDHWWIRLWPNLLGEIAIYRVSK